MAEVIIIDHGYEAIKKEILAYKNMSVEIGLWGDGDSPSDNLAARAAVHEFGSPSRKIPKRPFMRQTYEKNKTAVEKVIEGGYNLIVEGKAKAHKKLAQIGAWYEGRMKKEIRDGDFKELKETTVLRKGSSTPLIDTGDMRNSIVYKVMNGKSEVKE